MPTTGTRPLPGTRYFAAKHLTFYGEKYSPGTPIKPEIVEDRLRGFSLVSTRKVMAIGPTDKLQPWQLRMLAAHDQLTEDGQLKPAPWEDSEPAGGGEDPAKAQGTPPPPKPTPGPKGKPEGKTVTPKAPAPTVKKTAKKTTAKKTTKKAPAKKAAVKKTAPAVSLVKKTTEAEGA